MTETDLDLATEVERLKAQVDWNAARVNDLTERLEKSQAQIDKWAQISVIEGALADELAAALYGAIGVAPALSDIAPIATALIAWDEARHG